MQDGFVPYGLWKYFGYNAGMQCIQRDCYREEDMSWEDLVYDQIKKHGALLYCGTTAKEEGHAFVCDGYDTDGYFHFNWGWGGMSDGWYRLDALNPEHQGTGGSSTSLAFNYHQSIQAFVNPGTEGERFIACILGYNGRFNVANKSVKKGANFTVTRSLANLTQLDYDVAFGCLLTDSSTGTEGRVIEVTEFPLPSQNQKRIMNKAVFPEDVADGVYCMRPVAKWEGLDDWHVLPWNIEKDCVWIEVKDGMVYFNIDPETSGIEAILPVDDSASRYYNLQGEPVSAPEKGELYIRISPERIEKIVY